jgi:hypothetical protein
MLRDSAASDNEKMGYNCRGRMMSAIHIQGVFLDIEACLKFEAEPTKRHVRVGHRSVAAGMIK